MAELSTDEARCEVLELVEVVRADPRAWPDVRDPGSVEEIREAFRRRCWIQFMPYAARRMPGPSRYARSDGPVERASANLKAQAKGLHAARRFLDEHQAVFDEVEDADRRSAGAHAATGTP